MRKINLVIIAAFAILTSACIEKSTPVSGVALDKTSLTLSEGEEFVLHATVLPENASNKDVTWMSKSSNVASVSADGKVTARTGGFTTVWVTTVDGDKSASCNVTVTSPVEGISLDRTSLALYVGDSKTLVATITPSNAFNKAVNWTSSDSDVVSVDNQGTVSAIKAGTSTVTATSVDGGKTATCKVKVSEKQNLDRMPKSVAEQTRQRIISEWKAELLDEMKQNFNHLYVKDNGGNTMKFLVNCYGSEPKGGHSLWISLHGGGGTTTAENNAQWENQQIMYRSATPPQPTEGYYISPRAIGDAWNMWFFTENDWLFEEIIRTMVVTKNVNPDKVYLMGYSAGGDGVWRMAPRMADHWAAAAMMAGHPGSVNLVNVRNMPFTLWVGANDTAYNRNTEVPRKANELEQLHKDDPDGYIYSCNVVSGKPHWMDLQDAAAFPWMAQYSRNPYPSRIVWRQENEESMAVRQFFYWIKVNKDEMKNGNTVIAEIKGNTINIEKCDYKSLTIYLNDTMVDLDSPVEVVYNGRQLFNGKVYRNEQTLIDSMAERNDPSYAFYSSITVEL